MRVRFPMMMLLATLGCGVGAVGCTADVHDNQLNVSLDNATIDVSSDVDVSQVQQGESLPLHVNVEGAYLIEPNETPPPDKADIAAHLKFFLDDDSSEAILVTAQTSVNISIPADEPEGDHKVICRLYHHDDSPTDVEFELSITVHAKVSG